MIKIPDFPEGSYQGGLTKARDGKWFNGSGQDLKSDACYAALSPTRVGTSRTLWAASCHCRASSFASDEARASRSRRRSPSFTTDSTSPTWTSFTKGEALAGLRHEERD